MPRRRLHFLVALCFGLLASAPAASETPGTKVKFPVAQPAPLAARVALLEQRTYALDQRLKAFERVRLQPAPSGAYAMAVNGARVVIAKNGTVSVTPARSSVGQLPASGDADACDPPFSVNEKGIKSVKPGCMEVGPCEPPYRVDAKGRRIPKPECL